jgi:hypothetical protein
MLRTRLLRLVDRSLSLLLAAVLLGGILAFGGTVWWARPLLGLLIFLLVLCWLSRVLLEGVWRVFKSPLGMIGGLTIALAVFQLAPLPAEVARRVSRRSQDLHALGLLPELAQRDDPDQAMPPPLDVVRSPATVDRAATLRWILGALACLAFFVVSGQFADRVGHTFVIWGCVVAGFLINTTFGIVQLVGRSDGFYGLLQPGQGPWWAPSFADLLNTPVATTLRTVGPDNNPWAVPVPVPVFIIGSLMGGPGAYLALGSLGLPLTLGIALQLMAPRGSRQPLWSRLRESGTGSLVLLLLLLSVIGSGLIGFLSGIALGIPFLVSLVLVGLGSARGTGVARIALATGMSCLLALGSGLVVGQVLSRPEGSSALSSLSHWPDVREGWSRAALMVRDYPLCGVGLGGYSSLESLYKRQDQTTTAVQSSLSRWLAETGLAGGILLALAVLWSLIRIPDAWRRIGSADRALASGLLGATVGFGLFSALHWTVELPAVALAASGVLGTWNRWLAGGSDLFVDPS